MATDPNLDAGIAAVQAGDLARAQQLLALVVQAHPNSVDAWWWMAQAVTNPERRRFCLDRVLALDPRHAGALRLLNPSAAPKPPEPPPLAPARPPPEPAPATPDAIAALRAALPANDPGPEPGPAPVSRLMQAVAEPAATLRATVQGPAKELLATPLRLNRPQWLMLGGLALALFICLGSLTFAVNPALRATLFGPATVKALVLPTGTPVSYPTLPPEWTATPTRDPLAATATPRATSTPRPSPPAPERPADYAGTVAAPCGTGPFTLEPGQSLNFEFQAAAPAAGAGLTLTVTLLGPAGVIAGSESGLVFNGWYQAENVWHHFNLVWGAALVPDGALFVSANNAVFTTITNPTDGAIAAENLHISLNPPAPP